MFGVTFWRPAGKDPSVETGTRLLAKGVLLFCVASEHKASGLRAACKYMQIGLVSRRTSGCRNCGCSRWRVWGSQTQPFRSTRWGEGPALATANQHNTLPTDAAALLGTIETTACKANRRGHPDPTPSLKLSTPVLKAHLLICN